MQVIAGSGLPPSNYDKIYKVGVAVGGALFISTAIIKKNPTKNEIALIATHLMNAIIKGSFCSREEYVFCVGSYFGVLSSTIFLIEKVEGLPLSPLVSEMLVKSMVNGLLSLRHLIPKT